MIDALIKKAIQPYVDHLNEQMSIWQRKMEARLVSNHNEVVNRLNEGSNETRSFLERRENEYLERQKQQEQQEIQQHRETIDALNRIADILASRIQK